MSRQSWRIPALTALIFLGTVGAVSPAVGQTIPEALRNSPKFRAFEAWQHRAVIRRSVGSAHDTLAEYAEKCNKATGITVPGFSCANGIKVPGQGSVPASSPDATHCDRPNVLSGHCDPGSRFQVLPGRTADAVAVAHCRKVGLPIDGEQYGDIAVIQYNRQNGALCFYQALIDLPGSNIPEPIKGDQAKWGDGLNHWFSPEATEAIGCTGCHDNGGFIRSEYLAQLRTLPNALPTIVDGFNNFDTPSRYVGLDYRTNRSWSITAAPAPGDPGQPCTSCHRLAVPNRMVSGRISGTAAHFAAEATGASQPSKNAHGPDSPIWMRPGQVEYNERAEASAKIFQACAEGFFNSNFTTPPPGCQFAPLGAAYEEPPGSSSPQLVPIIDYILR